MNSDIHQVRGAPEVQTVNWPSGLRDTPSPLAAHVAQSTSAVLLAGLLGI